MTQSINGKWPKNCRFRHFRSSESQFAQTV
jgi:hypothetical protein